MTDVPEDGEPDPFDGLVLDEAFIRGARAHEPPARTREALSKPPRAARVWSAPAARPGRLRGVLTMVVVLGLVGGVAYLTFRPRGSSIPAAAALPQSSASASGSATPRPRPSPDELSIENAVDARGHCYTWNQKVKTTHAFDVTCSSPHLFEAVQPVTLNSYPQGAPFPTDAQWDTIVETRCRPLVTNYLRHQIDPAGKLYVTMIHPTLTGWDQDARDLTCGLGQRLPEMFGTTSPDYDSVAGRADAQHQALLYDTGTCLRFTAEHSGSVPCAAAHDGEVVGTFTLTGSGPLPTKAAYTAQAEGPCRLEVAAYLDRAFHDTSSAYTGYVTLRAPSWDAGTRTIECYLSFGSTLTGNHRATARTA